MTVELEKYGKKIDKELDDIDSPWKHKNAIDGERLYNALQQLLLSRNPEEDMMTLAMEEYIKYKKSYVKHLQFNQDIKNMSKFYLNIIYFKVIHCQLLW